MEVAKFSTTPGLRRAEEFKINCALFSLNLLVSGRSVGKSHGSGNNDCRSDYSAKAGLIFSVADRHRSHKFITCIQLQLCSQQKAISAIKTLRTDSPRH